MTSNSGFFVFLREAESTGEGLSRIKGSPSPSSLSLPQFRRFSKAEVVVGKAVPGWGLMCLFPLRAPTGSSNFSHPCLRFTLPWLLCRKTGSPLSGWLCSTTSRREEETPSAGSASWKERWGPGSGKMAPGTRNQAWAFRACMKKGKRRAAEVESDLHTSGPGTILLGWVEYQTRVSWSCTSPQPGNRQEKQRARPTDCHWQNELSPPIFQRRGGMNCGLEPCGPLLIEFRCLRTPSNKASSFQTDVPPLINLGASKINRFGADSLPSSAWIEHPERSPNKSLSGSY